MTLPVVIAELQKSFSITENQFATLNSLFLFAYALMYAGGGRLVDWFGTRFGYAAIMAFWSLSCMAHGLVSGFFGLAVFRFMLGVGEGGGFPASIKTVAEWFPARERSTAAGMFNTGASIGSVVAPPSLALIVVLLNWRWVFVLSGLLGVLWAILWLRVYRLPSEHPNITSEELDLIQKSHLEESREAPSEKARKVDWLGLFSSREVRCLLLVKFLTDPVWYFYIFWLPKYLFDQRGFDIKDIGYYAWIPYAAAGTGSLFGGWLSSYLLKRGITLNASRKIALAVSASLMPLAVFVVPAPTSLAIVFISIAFAGHQIWNVIMHTLPADLFPKNKVGSVAGITGASGAFGGMVFALVVGRILSTYASYAPVFIVVSLLHPLSFAMVMLMIPRIKRVE
jgi:ACS family hexuronate transporter-like MFS transporter